MNACSFFSAEPLKKRKVIDPNIEKERAKKRQKKLQSALTKLQKAGRKLKPIDEIRGGFFMKNLTWVLW